MRFGRGDSLVLAVLLLSRTLGCSAFAGDGEPGTADENDPALMDDHVLVAQGFFVVVPVLANDRAIGSDASVVLKELPRGGVARFDAARGVEYVPNEGFFGGDSLTYGVEGVTDEIARVHIEVVDQEWLLLDEEPFMIRRSPPPDRGEEPDALRWIFSDVSPTHIIGYSVSMDQERAFWPLPARLTLPAVEECPAEVPPDARGPESSASSHATTSPVARVMRNAGETRSRGFIECPSRGRSGALVGR